jgi:formimidoylglutamate deiminase
LFVEMLKAGYTSVAEFHYLHRRTNAAPYLGPTICGTRRARRGAAAGIGLTLLPTLYQASDFGGAPLKREQARFAMQTDEFLRAIAERRARRDPRNAGRNARAAHRRRLS